LLPAKNEAGGMASAFAPPGSKVGGVAKLSNCVRIWLKPYSAAASAALRASSQAAARMFSRRSVSDHFRIDPPRRNMTMIIIITVMSAPPRWRWRGKEEARDVFMKEERRMRIRI